MWKWADIDENVRHINGTITKKANQQQQQTSETERSRTDRVRTRNSTAHIFSKIKKMCSIK